MPTTRSQVIAVNHSNRSNRVDQGSASITKTPKRPNEIVPRRNDANEEPDWPPVVIVQATNVRCSSWDAPKLGNHMLFLFVGEARELITLHTDLLPEPTKLYIHEKNQGQQFYRLEEEDASIVLIYRNYLYTNKIFTGDEEEDMLNDETHADSEWLTLAHCYLFGVTVKDEKFRNTCVNAIIEKIGVDEWYPTGMAPDVYWFTEAGDKLRKLIVDFHVLKGEGSWIRAPHDDAEAGTEFFQDVVDGMAAAKSKSYEEEPEMPWVVNKCYYRSHERTPRCE